MVAVPPSPLDRIHACDTGPSRLPDCHVHVCRVVQVAQVGMVSLTSKPAVKLAS